MKDLYYILGTERDCTPGELNAAYRKLAQKLQPEGDGRDDHFLNNHFREITEAYKILCDPITRRKYDLAIKKNEKRRLYYFFKLKYINIAVTLALIMFTALFGYYVIKATTRSKTNLAAAAPVVVPRHKIRHTKRKHPVNIITNGAALPMAVHPAVIKPDTIQAAVVKPVRIRIDTPKTILAKRTWVLAPNPQPAVNPVADQPAATYTTQLRSNLNGVINMHEAASYASAVLSRIPNHSTVQVLEKGAGFYKVRFNDQAGYVPRWTIVSQ